MHRDVQLYVPLWPFLTWLTIQLTALRGRKRELPVSRGPGIYWKSTDIIAVLILIRIQDAALVMTRGYEQMVLRVNPPQKGLLTCTRLMFHYKWHFSILNILDLYFQKELISRLEYQSLQDQ